MKKLMAVMMVVVVCSVCLASDPNSMENPTAQNPVTKHVEESTGIMTLKMFFGDLVKEISESSEFNSQIRKFRRGISQLVFNRRVASMLKLHEGESQATLDAQVATKEE